MASRLGSGSNCRPSAHATPTSLTARGPACALVTTTCGGVGWTRLCEGGESPPTRRHLQQTVAGHGYILLAPGAVSAQGDAAMENVASLLSKSVGSWLKPNSQPSRIWAKTKCAMERLGYLSVIPLVCNNGAHAHASYGLGWVGPQARLPGDITKRPVTTLSRVWVLGALCRQERRLRAPTGEVLCSEPVHKRETEVHVETHRKPCCPRRLGREGVFGVPRCLRPTSESTYLFA